MNPGARERSCHLLALILLVLGSGCGGGGEATPEDGDAGQVQDSGVGFVDGLPQDLPPQTTDAGAADLPTGGPKNLPSPTQPCPEITEGLVTFLGATVRIWVRRGSMDLKGPLVLYWHGTVSNPLEANLGLGAAAITEIKNQGGMVAAPRGPTGLTGNQTGGVVWKSGDYALADEIVACAVQQVGIDTRRIHSMGMSAGGLHTSLLTYRRSGYLASVTTYSGGLVPILPPPPSQDPANKLPAIIAHGGEKDVINNFSFKTASEKYLNNLRSAGHFAFICDHGKGHALPPGGGAMSWQFFQDHPWGASPSPYQGGLPPSMPDYCSL
jgi:hypothetical protein